jgi:two-component system sensor histidine kinase ChiS
MINESEDDGLFADEEEESLFSDDEDEMDFSDEEDEESAPEKEGWKVLIVDDEPEIHNVTKMALGDFSFEGREINFVSAYSAAEAKTVLAEHPDVAMILLDVVMEEQDSGLQFARHVREEAKQKFARIILRTGQPGNAPEERVIIDYDINDYKAKTELTASRLFTTVISALRSFRDLRNLEDTRKQVEEYAEAAGHFVPHEFLKRMDKKSILEVKVGDCVKLDMAILFSDIRQFTTLSESMEPHETFKFLNSYIQKMEPSINRNGGFIDKYIGDAIMALFDTADHAVMSSIEMLKEIYTYNEGRVRAGYTPIEIGIGINTGPLMLGTIGGSMRMQETVISDAVNLASRIEHLTKTYSTPLLISEQTLWEIEDSTKYCIRYVDRVQVKGISEPAVVHEVFDADPDDIKELKLATEQAFSNAWVHFQNGEFREADMLFRECLDKNPTDPVARIYVERCQKELAG